MKIRIDFFLYMCEKNAIKS